MYYGAVAGIDGNVTAVGTVIVTYDVSGLEILTRNAYA
jgi:hypothetical protein